MSEPTRRGDASAEIDLLRRDLSADILVHLESLGLSQSGNGHRPDISLAPGKAAIRAMHSPHRDERVARIRKALKGKEDSLLRRFALGPSLRPSKIRPVLVAVPGDGPDADLFRFATLLWSVPVSSGFGRRLRFLVLDESNEKLIGVIGLTDPVFNLGVRDRWIGWDVEGRKERLVNVMDAFVLGAVPPYSSLLGGKLIASLVASQEVGDAFDAKYGTRPGVISQRAKNPRLVLVTVTSALGRSSVYNRLRLHASPTPKPHDRPLMEAISLGETLGYGHFHLTDALFNRIRDLLREGNHAYADGNRFGEGPNWRMRVVRAGLEELGLDPGKLRHGVAREVLAVPRASNAVAFLAGTDPVPKMTTPTAQRLGTAARRRWIVPRSKRRDDYRNVTLEDLRRALGLDQ